MPIEELTNEEVLQRCSLCQTATRSKLVTLSLGVGSTVADDLDGSVVRLPPCPKCKAEEFLIRSEVPPAASPTTYGDLHRLLVDQLHASLAKLGRLDARLKKVPTLTDLDPALVKTFFPDGLKLLAEPLEKLEPPP
jgi:hypothetical protein